VESISTQMQQILDGLGESAQDVAETLRTQRIAGIRNSVRLLNPIVRMVQATLLISNLGMDLLKPGVLRLQLTDGTKAEAILTTGVQDFLEAFNRGEYPDLEMPLRQHSSASSSF
jgi:hypothetical protein